ncbi:uncharacterized protein [Drosophila takahashii]|uniref:uncharacterized protein n=1 Tax=Drosophila takahashii TaxID=29030 RepID=UPI001CF81770|nr:uncharacterized protein LOC108062368 [Drosophila takahashii]
MCKKKYSQRKSAMVFLGVIAAFIPIVIAPYQIGQRQFYKLVITFGILVLWALLLMPPIYIIYKKKKYIGLLLRYSLVWLALSLLIFLYFFLNSLPVLALSGGGSNACFFTLTGSVLAFCVQLRYHIYMKKKMDAEDAENAE